MEEVGTYPDTCEWEEEEVVLDFLTAFRGSVFEDYHVFPTQLATLDTRPWLHSWSKKDHFWLLAFLDDEPLGVHLLKTNRHIDFLNRFSEFCTTHRYHPYKYDVVEVVGAFLARSRRRRLDVANGRMRQEEDGREGDEGEGEGGREGGGRSRSSSYMLMDREDSDDPKIGPSSLVDDAYARRRNYNPNFDIDFDIDGGGNDDNKEDNGGHDEDDEVEVELEDEEEEEDQEQQQGGYHFGDHDQSLRDYLAAEFKEFCIVHHPAERASCFCRSGEDAMLEADEVVAQHLYDYARSEMAQGDYDVDEGFRVHLIDFDLGGIDGKRFSLRMFMLDATVPDCETGWFAKVYDRQTGAVLAIADGARSGGPFSDHWTEVRLVPEASWIVHRKYKPHGFVPTMLKFSGRLKLDENRPFACSSHPPPPPPPPPRMTPTSTTKQGDRSSSSSSTSSSSSSLTSSFNSAHHRDPFLTRWTPEAADGCDVRSLTDEEVKALRKLHEASLSHGYLSYGGSSEFERLMPVAASLSRIHTGNPVDFDACVMTCRLRPSLLRDTTRLRRRLLQWIFKGSRWEDLPEDLMMRILSFLPQRHIYRGKHSKPEEGGMAVG